jgi:hypothetical protein
MQTSRAARMRTGISLEMAASATIAKEKTNDRSIDTMCSAAYRAFLKELNHSASDG